MRWKRPDFKDVKGVTRLLFQAKVFLTTQEDENAKMMMHSIGLINQIKGITNSSFLLLGDFLILQSMTCMKHNRRQDTKTTQVNKEGPRIWLPHQPFQSYQQEDSLKNTWSSRQQWTARKSMPKGLLLFRHDWLLFSSELRVRSGFGIW